jgi:hypothetical protein
MFLTGKSSYTKHGEQKYSGKFLIVFAHNKFKWAERDGLDWRNIPREFERNEG